MDASTRVGKLFDDKFELQQCLGSGGIGAVYKALQLDCQRTVAVKILHEHIAGDEEYVARLVREARSLERLHHKNIVTVYNMGRSSDGIPYMVMELIDGKSVRKILNESDRLPTRKALAIAMEAAQALAFVHQGGVIHRDLKPDNIILADKPEPDTVKLIDFGLARITEAAEQKLTRTREILGTVSYMSPEQCEGNPVGKESDIYSLAVCLFEMLTGHVPFTADTSVGVMYKQMKEAVPEIKPPDVEVFHPVLNEILARGMAKEPASRFVNMDEFAAALSSAIEQIGDSTPHRNRNVFLPLIAVACSLMVVLIASWSLFNIKSNKTKNVNAESQSTNVSAERTFEDLLSQIADAEGDVERATLGQRAYIIASKNTHKIPRGKRLHFMADFGRQLMAVGLPAEAKTVLNSVVTDVAANGLVTSSSGRSNFTTVDMERVDMARCEIFTEWGQNAEALKILSLWCGKSGLPKRNWESLLENSIALQRFDLTQMLIDECDDLKALVKVPSKLRRANKLVLAQKCLKAAERIAKTAPADKDDLVRLYVEQASLAVDTDRRQEALDYVKQAEKLLKKESDHNRQYGWISQLYGILGNSAKSLEYELLADGKAADAGQNAESISFAQLIEQLRSNSKVKPSTETVDALLKTDLTPNQRCEILLFRSAISNSPCEEIHFKSKAYFESKKNSAEIDRRIALACLSSYIHILNEIHLSRLSLRAAEEFLADIKKNGLPPNDPNSQISVGQNYVAAVKSEYSWALRLCFDNDKARKIFDEIPFNIFPAAAPWTALMDQSVKLGDDNASRDIISSCPSFFTVCSLAMTCLGSNKLYLADECLKRAQDIIISKVSTGPLNNRKVRFAVTSAFVRLESGHYERARQLLRPFLFLKDQTSAIKEPSLIRQFALAVDLASFDNSSEAER